MSLDAGRGASGADRYLRTARQELLALDRRARGAGVRDRRGRPRRARAGDRCRGRRASRRRPELARGGSATPTRSSTGRASPRPAHRTRTVPRIVEAADDVADSLEEAAYYFGLLARPADRDGVARGQAAGRARAHRGARVPAGGPCSGARSSAAGRARTWTPSSRPPTAASRSSARPTRSSARSTPRWWRRSTRPAWALRGRGAHPGLRGGRRFADASARAAARPGVRRVVRSEPPPRDGAAAGAHPRRAPGGAASTSMCWGIRRHAAGRRRDRRQGARPRAHGARRAESSRGGGAEDVGVPPTCGQGSWRTCGASWTARSRHWRGAPGCAWAACAVRCCFRCAPARRCRCLACWRPSWTSGCATDSGRACGDDRQPPPGLGLLPPTGRVLCPCRRTAARASRSSSARRALAGAGVAARQRSRRSSPGRVDKRPPRALRKLGDGPFPQDPAEQLDASVRAVFGSWEAPKARAYRRLNDMPDDLGTAVILQRMVFGNPAACRGRAWPSPAIPPRVSDGLYMDFLLDAQGEDIVAGRHTVEGARGAHAAGPRATRADRGRCARCSRRSSATPRSSSSQSRTASSSCCRPGRPNAPLGRAANHGRPGPGGAHQPSGCAGAHQPARPRRHPTRARRREDEDQALCRALPASMGVASGPIALDTDAATRLAAEGPPRCSFGPT